ncbi:TIR domain-containing protein [Hymenobacter sp. B81]|uniref:type II RES/Xre toxin-antitoxin system toxin n=1 Tax=Hymenobacter sp. B81 TaxID=3344878 RepID=UPI0037DCEDF7
MIIWRIAKKEYITDMSGIGGLYATGRWHHLGTRILYTSSSLELAILESLANQPRNFTPSDYALVPLYIPAGTSIKRMTIDELPQGWEQVPYTRVTQDLGTQWAKGMETCLLELPSLQSPYGKVYLINPLHVDSYKIATGNVESISFDPRHFNSKNLTSFKPTYTSSNMNFINQAEITKKYDVFICHASEDKPSVVEPLVKKLEQANINVWFDKSNIKWGDSITEKINTGLKDSKFVLVVLSTNFLRKNWPKREMNAALNIEASLGKVKVLPLVVGSDEEFKNIIQELTLQNDKLFMRWNNDFDEVVNAMKERLS